MNTDWTKRRENETKEDWQNRVREELEKLHQTILEESIKEHPTTEKSPSKLSNKWITLGVGIGICVSILINAGVSSNRNRDILIQNQETLQKIRESEARISKIEFRIARLSEKAGVDFYKAAVPSDF